MKNSIRGKIFNSIQNNKGVTLIEMTIAAAIALTIGVAVMAIMQSAKRQQAGVENTAAFMSMADNAIISATSNSAQSAAVSVGIDPSSQPGCTEPANYPFTDNITKSCQFKDQLNMATPPAYCSLSAANKAVYDSIAAGGTVSFQFNFAEFPAVGLGAVSCDAVTRVDLPYNAPSPRYSAPSGSGAGTLLNCMNSGLSGYYQYCRVGANKLECASNISPIVAPAPAYDARLGACQAQFARPRTGSAPEYYISANDLVAGATHQDKLLTFLEAASSSYDSSLYDAIKFIRITGNGNLTYICNHVILTGPGATVHPGMKFIAGFYSNNSFLQEPSASVMGACINSPGSASCTALGLSYGMIPPDYISYDFGCSAPSD